ncbi:MAG: TolB family protein [Armatimonadota bacterium]|jgi:TolB protein
MSDRQAALCLDLAGTSRIACTRQLSRCGEQVFTLRPDGSDLRALTGGPGEGDNWGPAWHPDGRSICVTSNRTGHAVLWLLARDGSDQRQLTGAAEAEDYEPCWAPHGMTIAFARGDHHADDLWLLDVPSGQARPLTREQRLDVSPAWSPDGRWIVFRRAFGRPPGLYIIPAKGGQARMLIPGTHASWAPDGARLACANGPSLMLLSVDAEGRPTGRARPVVCAAEMLVGASSWSPDGSTLVFGARVTDANGTRERLMIVAAAGGEPRDLAAGSQPSWSPWLD